MVLFYLFIMLLLASHALLLLANMEPTTGAPDAAQSASGLICIDLNEIGNPLYRFRHGASMDGWMNVWVERRMDGCMDVRMDGCMDVRMDGWMDV